MGRLLRLFWNAVQYLMQRLALLFFAILAGLLLGATGSAIAGVLPWLELYVDWNGSAVENAGMYAQITITIFVATLLFFLPTNRRIMVLENSHRRFAMNMQDVARAYGAVHAADRTGIFRIASEFDSVRERMRYLSEHPELSSLEPELLEVAAQMSHVSLDLAEIYSDERVSRARDFLFSRHQEIEDFNTRLQKARAVHDALKAWQVEVEKEEEGAAEELEKLKDELREILPELGFEALLENNANIVELPPKAAE